MKLLASILIASTICHAADDAAWQALLKQSLELSSAGKYAEAQEAFKKTLAEAESFGTSSSRFAISLNQAGALERTLGNSWAAEQMITRAIRILETQPDQQLALANALNNLSNLFLTFGNRLEDAEKFLRHALQLIMRSGRADPEDHAIVLGNLGLSRIMQGDPAEARTFLERALELLPNPHDKAKIITNLSMACYQQKELERALYYIEQAIPMTEAALGADHPNLVTQLYNLGRIRVDLKRWHEAEAPLRRALAILESTIGPNDPTLPLILASLSVVRRQAGDKKQARELAKRARAIDMQSLSKALMDARVHVTELTKKELKPRR